jgi:hypothetical protein
MARNLLNITDLIREIVRKERGVYLTYPQMMDGLDAGQMDAFGVYFRVYGINQTVHDALKPFKVQIAFASDTAGNVTYPADYLHLLAGVYTVYGSTITRVRFVESDEFPDAITGQLRAVSITAPIATDTSGGFVLYTNSQLIPPGVINGFYNYLRRPATPVFVFTQSGPDNRTINYNAGASTQLEWSDAYIDTIISWALKYFGVNMDEDKISAFAEQLNQETTT